MISETADGKQAYNTFIRLANQGVTVELFNRNTSKRVMKYDAECRDFCATLGVNNSAGLDGMIDQLHGSAIAHGAMACEVIVNSNATDIEDVLLVDPATFYEFKYIEKEHRYAIYQRRDDGKKIDLYEGNFFYVPHQPKPGSPIGTLQFLAAVDTMVVFYQMLADSLKMLNRIGTPRYLVTIDQEALLASIPQSMKATNEQQQKIYRDAIQLVERNLRSMGSNSDFVTFSSNKIDTIGGGVNGAGIDIRAWFEVLEPIIVNSFTLTPVLMGRLKSGSYSLGTVEFKIVTDTVDSMRRSSKRILENIINMWARVKGYPVYAVVTHNPINWEVQKEKIETELLKVEKARRAEEYRWISHDDAAAYGTGEEKADSPALADMFEYLTHQMSEAGKGLTEDALEKENTDQ